jgi:mono/diheme cytochrome c family protein
MIGAARAILVALAVAAQGQAAVVDTSSYRDGHARPRALAFNADDGLLYAALSTSDEIAIIDPGPAAAPGTAATEPRLLARPRVCRFPEAVVAMPGGGALVACRFDVGLRRLQASAGGGWRVRDVAAGTETGARGLAVASGGMFAYVASPASGGIKVVSLATGRVLQTLPTGLSPRAVRIAAQVGRPLPLLLVSNFIDHTVTVHEVADNGRLGAAMQTIRTDAPVLDMTVARHAGVDALLLLTHEDRPLTRARGPVEGLDSGVIVLPARPLRAGELPFDDPGPGKRTFVNLGERATPVIELAAVAWDMRGTVAITGAGSDNLLVTTPGRIPDGDVVGVGANPSAVAALSGGRFVTADRLSDTLTFVAGGKSYATLGVGSGERATPAERGEVMFYSRALVPNNVADGAQSLYTCAACHDDGHIDGRRHPAKRDRFFSMTKTCRGLGTTAPYLSIGDPATIDAFADNIVATHAQGRERDAERFDKYPVTLRVRASSPLRNAPRFSTDPAIHPTDWAQVVLPPAEVRAALAAYMVRIPPEPSPFVAPSRRVLTATERRGLALFRDGCAGCHQLVRDAVAGGALPARQLEAALLTGTVALTSPRRHAVGTPVLGEGGNNPPSLRGVWEAAPYFSDGSARTLEEVLLRTDPDADAVHAPANATRPPAFSAAERAALLALLRAL